MDRNEHRNQQLVNSLVGAVEGGTGYWAYASDYDWGSENGQYELGDTMYASVTLTDMESGVEYKVTVDTIAKGWNRIINGDVQVADRIVESLKWDDSDAESDDCVVQAGLFGEIIYG